MRRRYNQNAQRTVWVPARQNKRSREKLAEIDGQLINRANRLGWGFQPLAANGIEPTEEIEPEPEELIGKPPPPPKARGTANVPKIKGENMPIVDLRNYNKDGKKRITSK